MVTNYKKIISVHIVMACKSHLVPICAYLGGGGVLCLCARMVGIVARPGHLGGSAQGRVSQPELGSELKRA